MQGLSLLWLLAGIGFLVFTNLDLFLHYSYDCVMLYVGNVLILEMLEICLNVENVSMLEMFACWKMFECVNV